MEDLEVLMLAYLGNGGGDSVMLLIISGRLLWKYIYKRGPIWNTVRCLMSLISGKMLQERRIVFSVALLSYSVMPDP